MNFVSRAAGPQEPEGAHVKSYGSAAVSRTRAMELACQPDDAGAESGQRAPSRSNKSQRDYAQ